MTVGRIFMWRATARRAFFITTIAMELLRMWRLWREWRLTKMGGSRQAWERRLRITTATGGWIFSKQTFLTIRRFCTAMMAEGCFRMLLTLSGWACTHN